ncbi:MAG: RidA family protein [Scytonema sp. RU_4_4]|nr:RidA family protein [Scytonema sp. RU_4_4]
MKFIAPFITIILLNTVLTSSIEAKQKEPQQTPQQKISQTQQQTSSPDSIEYLTSAETTSLNLPFSEAVRVGNMLYLSGTLGNIPGTKKLVPGGIKAETKQTMENIKRILEKNGSSLSQVVTCNVMLADIKEWGAMNQLYVTYFPKNRLPARSTLGASGLALNARVEIQCMATVK